MNYAAILKNKHILLGITGSIAAYKSADLVRRLREKGAIVRVVMTENAKRFITPLTLQAVSGHPVHDDLFDLQAEAAMGHIELARWADLILVAPASAGFMARLAHGFADDILTTSILASTAPVVIAPAMNQAMWQHSLTQNNLSTLESKGIKVLGTNSGDQACGDTGYGRMLEPLEIIASLPKFFTSSLLTGVNILMTAGPTQEAIDPVRFIMNASSGKMGYALADAAIAAGANVTLISGPVTLTPPPHLQNFISVQTAEEMHASVMHEVVNCDIFLAVAAVSDYKCQTISDHKIAKTEKSLHLILERNPDIVHSVGEMTPHRPFIIGFAAETENVIANAQAKRERKHMDVIIANRVAPNIGIRSDDNEVSLITADNIINLPLQSKTQLAKVLIGHIASIYKKGLTNESS